MNFLAFKNEGTQNQYNGNISGASTGSAEPECRHDPCMV
jgi:hypothetical protein